MTRTLQNLNNWHVFYILVLITFFTSLTSGIINPDKADMAWWSGFLQNFSTEMMGAIATFALFELVIEARKREEDKQDATDKEKATLIIQMKSSDNGIAVNAVEQLRANDWLKDGSLAGANLYDANLSGANLRNANLQGAKLNSAKLSGAFLGEAKLEGVNWKRANLQFADLTAANLQGANLYEANLQAAKLYYANLEGAELTQANLDDVEWIHSDGSSPATLPDGTKWTGDTDMERFTSPFHLDFGSTREKIKAIREEQGHRTIPFDPI